MSTRHLFNSSDGLVAKSLRGMVAYNPRLGLDETHRVVFDPAHDRTKVSIIAGGGAGHEPAWAGYVGNSLLAASISGDVFASPTTKQVLAAAERAPTDVGTIMVIGNYTGDCLHFGLANEKLIANGSPSRLLICGDDVSVGRGNRVGRRGLPGHVPVLKMIGGAAEKGGSLDEVYALGVATSEQTVTIAATLDRCHVPGRRQDDFSTVAADAVELGSGVHNEPGFMKISPAPAADELVRQMLRHCLDESDKERGYMHLEPGDETVLLCTNLGGMSYLEMGALVDEALEQLETDWKVVPERVYSGPAETSLNAPAFSISIINLTAATKSCSYTTATMKDLLDLRTDTHWESLAGSQSGQRRPRQEQLTRADPHPPARAPPKVDLKVESRKLERALRTACDALVASEPDLTRWDTVMGDGDCGETVKTGATSLLEALDGEKVADSGSVNTILATLEEVAESRMGGTLGGILGILFASLRAAIAKEAGGGVDPTSVWAAAVTSALTSLRRYTPAKVGDRTVMDTLIPFAEALESGSLDAAVDAAVAGAESTRKIAPRLGRATYVGVKEGEELPPDPGAWAAAVAVKGLRDGMNGS